MSKSSGISSLLATVLLIAATVVTTTMLSGWVSSTTIATQNTIVNKTTEGVACAAAEIVIDDVYSGAGSGSVARAIVRNSGGSDNLQITSAQLYDKFGNNFTTVNTLPSNLNKGQMATLNFNNIILPTTTNDSSHGINNGSFQGGMTYTLNGKYESALNFDGINDYVDIGSSSTLNVSNTLTVVAWINPITVSGRKTIYQNGNAIDVFSVEINDDKVSVIVPGVSVVLSTLTVNASTWNHIAYTRNGTGTGTHTVYINGVRESIAGNDQNFVDKVVTREIGRRSADNQMFNGIIDEVAVWNRSLTNAEINTSMSAGPLSVINTNDLVGYWKFDEGKGILSCPSDFSRVVVTTNCGGVSAEFSKPPKC